MLIFVAVFAVFSGVAGVGLGWLTALAGSVKIINWLTIPTATANLIHAIGGLFFPVNFYAVLQVTRAAGIVIIAVSLPLLWWRFRHDDRQALTGIAWAMLVVVLFVPAALPWYYTWPLAVVAPLAQSRRGGRGDRRILHLDHGHLQTRWRPWHVLVDRTSWWPRRARRSLGTRCHERRSRQRSPPSPAEWSSVRHGLRAAQHFASLVSV